jgi:toxin ParE2
MDAVRYYNAQRPQLGEEFREEARETIKRITRFPSAWHALSTTIRRCQMTRFPYGLIYTATEAEVLIVAIAHLHREPEYWRSRFDEI